MRFSYQTEQWLPYPLETVFAFFADPQNLPRLMPEWQKAKIDHANIVAPPTTKEDGITAAAGVGSRITLSFLPFPAAQIRLKWEAEISEFSRNSHFCDRQIRGPFAYWKHCHRMRSVPSRGIELTLLTDEVEYEPPFGVLGRLAHRLFLRRQIERSFAERQARLAEILANTYKPSQASASLRNG